MIDSAKVEGERAEGKVNGGKRLPALQISSYAGNLKTN